MIAYIAMQGRSQRQGTFPQCVLWARDRVQSDGRPVKILKARAGEKDARIVAEIAKDGERLIRDGRYVRVP